MILSMVASLSFLLLAVSSDSLLNAIQFSVLTLFPSRILVYEMIA